MESSHCTVILSATADGNLLPPFVIFRVRTIRCHLFTATDPHDLLTSQGGSQFNESDFPILQFMLNWRGTWINPVPLCTGLLLNYFSYGQATASIAYHWPASSLLSNSFFTAE